MPRSLTHVELMLGLDCALKLRYAREGLPFRSTDEDTSIDPREGLGNSRLAAIGRELVIEHYWACFAPEIDARKATSAQLRRLLTTAAADSRASGLPVRIRGATFRVGGVLSAADELVVHPDHWEVAKICAKSLPDEPAGLLTARGATRAMWKPYVDSVGVSCQIVARWLAVNARSVGVAPNVPLHAHLIVLRETVPSQGSRSLGDFGLEIESTGACRFSTRRGKRAEGNAAFRRLPIELAVDTEPLARSIDRMVDLARTEAWPDPKACYALRCKTCEFRLPGDPGSGFARCWGSDAVYRPDHILNLPRLSESQLDDAIRQDGPSATFASLGQEALRPSQEAASDDDGLVVRISSELQQWAHERKDGWADVAGDRAAPQAHFLAIHGASVPVPAWPGARPFQMVPFQFSAHLMPTEASPLEDRIALPGFVRCDLADPRREFIDALRAQLSGDGPVYHWHDFERSVLTGIRESIAAERSLEGDADRLTFVNGLVGADRRDGGRLSDLRQTADGYQPPSRVLSRALRSFVRHAWRYERIALPFRSTTARRSDPVTYDDPVDPAHSLPLAPPLPGEAEPAFRSRGLSALDAASAAELWLQLRTGARQDFAAVHETLRAWGHLESASVLIAHHFLMHVAPALARQAADRTVRVFISSTFRDFREERNLLKQDVESALNKRAMERMVQATIVDLRWGITNEQVSRGLTLPTCLGEVARCRPYFVGLLGERYGWVPPESAFASEVVDAMPWLKEHIGGCSITELEIRHGALDATVNNSDAYFYFRDPGFAAGKGDDFVSRDASERRRLGVLKQAIRDRGFVIRDRYPDPNAFAKLVTEDLWTRIDAAYPRDLVGDAALEDWTAHQSRAARLLRHYQPDHDALRSLRDSLTDRRTRRITVKGPAGSGKSSFVAKALEAYVGSSAMVQVMHFVGVGETAARCADIARRIVLTARRLLGETLDDSEPVPAPESVAALHALGEAAIRRGATLVIAMDGLDAVHDVGSFEWLRAEPPNGVKLVLTALPGGLIARNSAACRGSRSMRLPPLDRFRARKVVLALLAWHGRTLPESQLTVLLDHSCASNPGYLHRLIEELTVSADHETVPDRLRECLLARSLAGLCDIILRRVESELGRTFVASALRTLMDQQAGLSESEFVSKLDEMHAETSALRLRLSNDLVDAGGRISIPPGAFADALRKRYPAPE